MTEVVSADSVLVVLTTSAVSDATSPQVFDVFLSHNSREKAVVERIAERLKREGIEPWLDNWCLTPGGDWQDELADGLRRSSSCAVFVGPCGIGDWERLELKLATDRMAKDRTFRVFLVLLPGLPEPFDTNSLPPFLRTRTWVDLRKGIADLRAFQRSSTPSKASRPALKHPSRRATTFARTEGCVPSRKSTPNSSSGAKAMCSDSLRS